MPISKTGRRMMSSMKEQYGDKEGEQVFYAMENQGRVPGMKKNYAQGGMAKKDKMGYAKGGMTKKNKMGYAQGGMVKSTGKMNTGIRKCGE